MADTYDVTVALPIGTVVAVAPHTDAFMRGFARGTVIDHRGRLVKIQHVLGAVITLHPSVLTREN